MLLNHFKRINDIAVSCEYRSAQHNNNRQIENGKKLDLQFIFNKNSRLAGIKTQKHNKKPKYTTEINLNFQEKIIRIKLINQIINV